MKKVTILLATYNRAHLIGETLNSIIAQTYKNWECIIVDDFSTDNTPSIVQEFMAKDSRILYYKKEGLYKKGLPGSRNYGLDLAEQRESEYIQFFDDDDIMHPEKIERQIHPMLNDSSLDLTICKYEGFRKYSDLKDLVIRSKIDIESKNLAEDFLFHKIRINSAGPLFKSYLFKSERFDEDLPYGEERELFLRIFFRYKPNYIPIDEYLFFYRHHAISITARQDTSLEKIGAEILIVQKLWDYLFTRELLNSKVIAYFIRQFLLANNNKTFIKKVKSYLNSKSNLDNFSKYKFKSLILLHNFYSKAIFKILLFKTS